MRIRRAPHDESRLSALRWVDVPNVPMPRRNDTEMFANRLLDMSLGALNAWWDQARPAALGPPRPAAAPARA